MKKIEEKKKPTPAGTLTRSDAARMLGVGVRTFDRYLANGTIDRKKVEVRLSPQKIFFRVDALADILKGGD